MRPRVRVDPAGGLLLDVVVAHRRGGGERVGDVAVAPLCIALVAALAGLMRPAALLIWQTSAFEIASWAALGASLGYYFARSSLQIR